MWLGVFMSEMSSGEISLPHVCPCAKYECAQFPTTANSFQELYALFGFRNMDDAMRNQSWCKSCRAKDNAERRARKSSS